MKVLITILFISFITSALGRIQVTQTIAINFTDIIVSVFFLLFLFQTIRLRKLPEVHAGKQLLIFVGVAIVSLAFNAFRFPMNTLVEAALYLFRFIAYSSIYFLFSSHSEELKIYMKKLMLLGGYILVIGGFLQYLFYQNLRNLYYLGWDDHLYRLFSSFLDPNFAGVFFVLFFFFVLLDMNDPKRKSHLSLSVSFILLTGVFTAILLTFSRSAYIAFLVGAVIYLILMGKKKLIGALGIGAVILVLLLSPTFGKENMNLFRRASSNARLVTLNHAVKIIQDNPLIGVGFDAYRYTQIRYGFVPSNPRYPSHADAGTDNSYLFVLATTGIIGFIAYIVFLGKLIQSYRTEKSGSKIVVFVSLGVLMTSAFFINSLFYTPFLLWLWSLLSITERT